MGFSYERKDTDAFGHVIYYCKCSKCGYDCVYSRIVDADPLCQECYEKERQKKNRVNARRKPVNDLVRAIRGYYESYDAMPNMKVIEELAESVIGG